MREYGLNTISILEHPIAIGIHRLDAFTGGNGLYAVGILEYIDATTIVGLDGLAGNDVGNT
ncbi:hypothetical protein GCM10008106_17040 [Mongoliitalea lutea]|uniref:Uncharacterized protein n=1 Tax=Mongoliitalea lutea TaxID=849756 RepID=A0A8J3CWG5_9BACT|nr:hypothetical protein GCM10008106_17040 [Mongoliitalea lutea]